ncbi:hypothetical protein K435DRAFT_879888 [Dendrothele bispora CBS 962.96]|uniref:Uncharacterized protein n=1 Tax=Dendrothele bispora (strain CBS 962.96) TaxID=1314807 RepID=A0A4S8KKD9_DENBC|nr:hypothetical protein K435DRAFT_879888 [Dendrothele bispora CBS 962.96]
MIASSNPLLSVSVVSATSTPSAVSLYKATALDASGTVALAPELYTSGEANQNGPISEGVIVSIVVVLIIAIVTMGAFTCLWACKGLKSWQQRSNHGPIPPPGSIIPLSSVRSSTLSRAPPNCSQDTLPEYFPPPPTYRSSGRTRATSYQEQNNHTFPVTFSS